MTNLLLISLMLLTLLIGYLHPITAITQDLGRHILTGNIILSTHHVPKTNLFSYTYPDFPFINHHYGSEIIFALLQKYIGFQGLLIIMSAIALAAFALVLFAAKKHASILAISLISLLSLGVLYERTDLRPELFSFLFTALFVVILYRFRHNLSKRIFLLVPLQLAWIQIHIYFPVGILLVTLFLVDAVVSHRKNLRDKQVAFLLWTILGCGISALFNPNGLSGALYPLHVFQNYGYSIEENQNIFFLQSLFHKTTIRFFETYLVLAFLSFTATAKKRSLIDWLLLIVFAVMGIQAERNMPLLIFSTFIPVSESLSDVLSEVRKSDTVHMLQSKFPVKPLLLFLIAGLFVWQLTTRMSHVQVASTLPSGASPAVDFLKTNHLPQPIFNNFDIGSYLEYRLYPKYKVFVDGRPEAYPAEFFQNTYIPMQTDPKIFAKIDDAYHFQTIFFSHTDQTPWAEAFLKNIVHDTSWSPVYLDDTIIIFLKNDSQNAVLIKQFGITSETLHVSGHEENTKPSLSNLLHFFSVIGDTKHLTGYLERLLLLDPKNCQALSTLTNMYAEMNPALSNIYGTRYQQSCQ